MEFLAAFAVLLATLLALTLVLLAVLLRIVLPLVLLLGLFLVGLSVIALYPGSIIWAYRDAKARGKPAWALALFVAISPFLAFIGWPLSLLAWVVFRPEKKSDYKNIPPPAMAGTAGHA
jgi:hypothetical protein